MKHNCPFCNRLMNYSVEKQYYDTDTLDYLIHKCSKSSCNIGAHSKCKIWEYQGQVQGTSIILDSGLKTYKIVSRYDMNKTTLSKVEIQISFNSSENIVLSKIIEINESIKIDLADPINSGLFVLERLMNLRAFS